MNKTLKISIFFTLTFILISFIPNHNPPYKDANTPIEERVDDLLHRMTLEEKFWQLYMIPADVSGNLEKFKHGIFGLQISTKGNSDDKATQLLQYSQGKTAKETLKQINKAQKYFVEETRLGIPFIAFDEALHGLIRKGATSFPQSIALAASWDTMLMRKVSETIALQTKSRGIRQVLSPVINIARDVRWGRTEETYGEDPFLTSQMAISYISAFEKLGIITTPKHFVANVGNGGRDSYPIHYNERLLEEIYFPAFKASVQKASAQSIMTSYNSLDGTPCTANNWLLNKKLKQEWGFKGFVISDAGATGGANVLHFTAKDYTESTKAAIEGGLDVIFQTSYKHFPLFYKAFEDGLIDKDRIDDAVRRVLRAKFKLGLFESPYIDYSDFVKLLDDNKAKSLAKRASQESIVLLKNKNNILPLDKSIKSIAIFGQDAIEARQGGYSGPGNNPISILQGIKNKIGSTCKIKYSSIGNTKPTSFITIPKSQLYHNKKDKKVSGLEGQYFNNTQVNGKPILIRTDKTIDFKWTLYSPYPEKIDYDNYSIRWTGKLISSETGDFDIGIYGDDGYRLYLNDKLIIDNWRKQTVQQITKKYHFEKNRSYDIKIEFYETRGNVNFKLVWNQDVKDNWNEEINAAVKTASQCDISIVVAGIEEGEFRDRAFLNLPGNQEQLIQKIASAGKPVIVILVGGSAITMRSWRKKVNAIIDIWYPGEEGGNAVADVLFGDFNPAGRLPITFPIDVAQTPLYYNHKPTGRGDDYMNLSGKALFPFGYGLSYTQFEYSDMKIINPEMGKSDSTLVTFKIKNTGGFDGDEVVQLYIKDMFASVARPVLELKGFQRVHIKKGETKTIKFKIIPELLEFYDKDLNPVIESGDFKIMIGASSNDIRLKSILKIK